MIIVEWCRFMELSDSVTSVSRPTLFFSDLALRDCTLVGRNNLPVFLRSHILSNYTYLYKTLLFVGLVLRAAALLLN